jgi:hypothetical protein
MRRTMQLLLCRTRECACCMFSAVYVTLWTSLRCWMHSDTCCRAMCQFDVLMCVDVMHAVECSDVNCVPVAQRFEPCAVSA